MSASAALVFLGVVGLFGLFTVRSVRYPYEEPRYRRGRRVDVTCAEDGLFLWKFPDHPEPWFAEDPS